MISKLNFQKKKKQKQPFLLKFHHEIKKKTKVFFLKQYL